MDEARRATGLPLLGVGVAQAALVVLNQRAEMSHWLDRPFLFADYAYHYYFAAKTAESLRTGVGNAAYDPGMFGGMDIWPLVTPSDRVTISLLSYLPSNAWPAAFNLLFLGMFVLMPLLWTLSLTRFGVTGVRLWVGGAIGIGVFWLSLPSFLMRGIVTFPFSIFVSLYLAAETYAFLGSWQSWRGVLIALGFAFSIYIHPASLLVSALFVGSVLVARRADLSTRILPYVGLAVAASLALNYPWASLVRVFSHNSETTATALTFSSLAEFWSFHYGEHGLWGLRVFFPLVVIPLTWRLFRADSTYRRVAGLAAIWTLAFAVIYVFGSFMPVLDRMQPARFNAGLKVAGALYLALLAAKYVTLEGLKVSRLVTGGAALLCLGSVVGAWRVKLAQTLADHPLGAVIAMLGDRTPDGSRIFVLRGPHDTVTPETDEECIFGTFLNREFIGTEWIVPTLSRYGNHNIAARPALRDGTGTPEEWEAFAALWAIEYVLVPARCEAIYSRWMTGVDLLDQAGGYLLYRVRSPGPKFLEGSGHVSATLNRLAFTGVVPNVDGRVTVAYHWSTGFRLVGAPGARVDRKVVAGDDYGLLSIVNPPRDFVVTFDLGTARSSAR